MAFSSRYSAERPCWEGNREAVKSANTTQLARNGSLIFRISYPRWQHSFKAPNKAFHIGINFSFKELHNRVSSLKILLGVGEPGGRRCKAKLQMCWGVLQREHLSNSFYNFSFCFKFWSPRRALEMKPFLVAKEIPTKPEGFLWVRNSSTSSRSNKRHTGGQVYCLHFSPPCLRT